MPNLEYDEERDRKNTQIRLMLLNEKLAFIQEQIEWEKEAFIKRRNKIQ